MSHRRPMAIDAYLCPYRSARPPDWATVFGRDAPLDLEVGCGLGEFLVDEAGRDPGRDLVGIELDWARVRKTLERVARVRRGRPGELGNLRVMQVDARVALTRLFRERSLARIISLFPCPWPKKSHVKHRLFSAPLLRLASSRLVDGGGILIVTDDLSLRDWITEQAAGTGFDVRQTVTSARFGTKFERKWFEGGQEEFYELRLTKTHHHPAAVEEDEELQLHFVDDFQPERFEFEDVVGETSVIFKELLFDAGKAKGMARLVVAEPGMTQQVWVSISRSRRRWCIAKAEGHTALPTPGVALALRLVRDAARAGAGRRPEEGA